MRIASWRDWWRSLNRRVGVLCWIVSCPLVNASEHLRWYHPWVGREIWTVLRVLMSPMCLISNCRRKLWYELVKASMYKCNEMSGTLSPFYSSILSLCLQWSQALEHSHEDCTIAIRGEFCGRSIIFMHRTMNHRTYLYFAPPSIKLPSITGAIFPLFANVATGKLNPFANAKLVNPLLQTWLNPLDRNGFLGRLGVPPHHHHRCPFLILAPSSELDTP